MWKAKLVSLALAVMLLLSACGASGDKKSDEVFLYEGEVSGSAIDAAEEQYETTTVRREDYQEIFSSTGELEYTDVDTIYIDDQDAVLDSIKVKKGQRVKKGDVLAVYHVETSETKLQKQKLLNDQARAEYEAGLSNLNKSLSDALNEQKQLATDAEKKMKDLEIKKMRKEIEAYKKGEKEIREQEKDYERLVRLQSKTNFVAKKGGVVTSVKREYVGEELDASKGIIKLRNNDKWLIKVKDSASMLRYNMDVKVRLGKSVNDYQHEMKGKVITASDITGVAENDESGDAVVYVDISEADKKKYDFEKSTIYIYAVSFEVKDALMVDASAVNTESVGVNNVPYVYVLEDGKLHKRFVVSNYKNDKDYLIEQGVSENQTLAIVEQY
ncbi:MAG: efflux RND transporter periplasmic adaptor subunit [Roseburia sp.]|nr:efflux RND transporter periplasmic adaptor subunit [Roseburia sp.]